MKRESMTDENAHKKGNLPAMLFQPKYRLRDVMNDAGEGRAVNSHELLVRSRSRQLRQNE